MTVIIRVLEATQPGATHAGDDVMVTLRFHDVDEFKMQDFNHCNQIAGLRLSERQRGHFTTGKEIPPHLLVTFEPGFGMNASFLCSRMEVMSAESADPD